MKNFEYREAPNGYLNPNNPNHRLDDVKASIVAEQALAVHSLAIYARDEQIQANREKDRFPKRFLLDRSVPSITNKHRAALIVDVLLSDGYGRSPGQLAYDTDKVYEHILKLQGEKPDPTLKKNETLPLKKWSGRDIEQNKRRIFIGFIGVSTLYGLVVTPYMNRVFVRYEGPVRFIDGKVAAEKTPGLYSGERYPAYYFTYDRNEPGNTIDPDSYCNHLIASGVA